MAEFDLDAARAARAKKRKQVEGEDGEAPKSYSFVFGGEEFLLPLDPPWGFIEAHFGAGDRIQLSFHAVRSLLGNQYDRFIAHQPEIEDAGELIAEALKLYGMASAGESSASGGSSSDTSSRSRRTSNGSTKKTSPKRSGGKTA